MKERDEVQSKGLQGALDQITHLRTMVQRGEGEKGQYSNDVTKAHMAKNAFEEKLKYLQIQMDGLQSGYNKQSDELRQAKHERDQLWRKMKRYKEGANVGNLSIDKLRDSRDRPLSVELPQVSRVDSAACSPVLDTNNMILQLFKMVTAGNNSKRPVDNFLINPTKFDGADGQLIEDFLSDVDRYIRVNDYNDEMSIEVLRKYLYGKALINFTEQRRVHPGRSYNDWKEMLFQRYHVEGSRTLAAAELRQLSYRLNDDFDMYYEKVMNLCDKLQADMPPEVRVDHLISGIMSPEVREKLFNFEMTRPEQLRSHVNRILCNMKDIRNLKQAIGANVHAEKAPPKEVIIVENDKQPVYEEKFWHTSRGDPLCAGCGLPEHFRRQCDSKATLPQLYARPPAWLLAIAENTRVPRPTQQGQQGGNRPYYGKAEQVSEN